MFCPKCGAQNFDDAVQCSSCGNMLKSPGNYQGNMPDVPSYLVWSILATIFCCLPLGIPAIVFSSQVDTRLRMGDYQGAVESSRKAKTFCWVSFGLGLAFGLIYFLVIAAGALSFNNITNLRNF